MRKTKIVCTIGPASSDRAVFADMCRAGMNVARLNFSHGTHEEQKAKLDMIRSVREELGLPIAILLDTKGPEYRPDLPDEKIPTITHEPRVVNRRGVIIQAG